MEDPRDDALDRFLDAGYTFGQAELIRRMLHEGAPAGDHEAAGYAIRITSLLVATITSALVLKAVGDIAIGLIVGGLVSVTVASFTSLR